MAGEWPHRTYLELGALPGALGDLLLSSANNCAN